MSLLETLHHLMVIILLIPWAVVRKGNDSEDGNGAGDSDAQTDTRWSGQHGVPLESLGCSGHCAAPAMTWKSTV